MKYSPDTIYAKAYDHISDFQFDHRVAGVFTDMIQRSIPGYNQIIHTIGELAQKHVKPQTNIYDLGCSLGTATLSIRRQIEGRHCHIIAVDNSDSMILRCQENLNAYVSDTQVDMICGDIRNINIENASMVVLNFTLQFLPPADRQALLAKIYQGMVAGGLLIISEKIRFEDDSIQHLIDDLHLDFKRANGYSELEISQKRTALENVMRPDTLEQHQQRAKEIGFSHFSLWFQCFNFTSMVAIK